MSNEPLRPEGAGNADGTGGISPAAGKLIAACLISVIFLRLFAGWALLASIIAVFVVLFLMPVLRISLRKKLIVIGVIVAIVAAIQIGEVVKARQLERAKTKATEENARKAADDVAALQQKFNAMTPAEHLAEVRRLLYLGAPGSALIEAEKHIAAMPPGSPDARSGAALRLKYLIDAQKRTASITRQAAKESAATAEADRIAFCKTVEGQMLDQNYDFDVDAIGPKHTILRMKWVLVSKAFAYQFSKRAEMFETARELGFRKIELTDGFDQIWSWNLD